MGFFSKLGFGSKQTIAVTFLEEGTGRVIGKVDLPIGQLPDTFAIETQLDIAKQKYMVVKSEPPTKAEFSKTGKLVNTLRKVEAIDPSKMLFSLPTRRSGPFTPITTSRSAGTRSTFAAKFRIPSRPESAGPRSLGSWVTLPRFAESPSAIPAARSSELLGQDLPTASWSGEWSETAISRYFAPKT
jgi:hypothetical protein